MFFFYNCVNQNLVFWKLSNVTIKDVFCLMMQCIGFVFCFCYVLNYWKSCIKWGHFICKRKTTCRDLFWTSFITSLHCQVYVSPLSTVICYSPSMQCPLPCFLCIWPFHHHWPSPLPLLYFPSLVHEWLSSFPLFLMIGL